MLETEEFLRELKKEIIEARALIIKSNNILNSLAAEVRSIARRQAGYERRMSWNSIVAYVLFVALAYGGIRLGFEHQESQYLKEIGQAKKATEEVRKELLDLKNKTRGQVRDEKRLLELYQLIRTGKMDEALAAYNKIDRSILTETEKSLFEDHMATIQGQLSIKKYNQGLDLVAKKKYPEAVAAFQESLELKKDAGHAPAVRIELANALRLQGKPREAIAVLQQLIDEQIDRELADDAYWYLAMCYAEAHQKDEARTVLKNLIRQFPDSQWVREARFKISDLTLHLYKEDE